MMLRDIFSNIIKDYADYAGIEELIVHPGNKVYLTFDPAIDVTLDWRPESQQLYVYSVCEKISAGFNTGIFYHLLAANYFWAETAGATVSIDKKANLIYIIEMKGIELLQSVTSFSEYLDQFVEIVAYYRNQIEQLKQQPSKHPPQTIIQVNTNDWLRRTQINNRV
jgi:Tir chaperone protein (CesT) family